MGKVRPLSFTLSSIGSTALNLMKDKNPGVPLKCYRMTVKVRTLGTNTQIGIGDVNGQSFNLIAAQDAMTHIAPIIKGDTVPFDLLDFWVVGDNPANDGVIEVNAIVEG